MRKFKIVTIISFFFLLTIFITFNQTPSGNVVVANSKNTSIEYLSNKAIDQDFTEEEKNESDGLIQNSSNIVDYDVIVIGGDPEGVAAAVSAARNGAKTLLVEERDGLGGLLTYGMLNQIDLGYDKDGLIANQGIFKEWFDMVGGKGTFDIQKGKDSFTSLVEDEENITLLLNTKVKEVIKNNQQVIGIVTNNNNNNNGEENTIYAKRFIDATANADFAVMSGVPYFYGQEDLGLDAKMCVTLIIVLKNVDWNEFSTYGKTLFGGGTISSNIAWGFADLPNVYQPIEENTRLRGLNVGIQDDSIVTINALQIFGVDGTDDKSVKDAIEIGKSETDNIVKFLQENMPGFEQAQVAFYPSELYIRETRHILAEYQLSITDIWENKDQWDSIGIGAYPADVQATNLNKYGYYVANPIQYAIPFRSLIPLEIDSLLVASKCAGYSSLAAGSARTVPIGMTVGQAAGTAAALSITHEIDFRDISSNEILIEELQKTLINQGALLYNFDLDYPYKGEWYYSAIKKLLPLGIIMGGYDNDLQVDDQMTEYMFLKLLAGAFIRSDSEKSKELFVNFHPWLASNEVDKSQLLTRDKAVDILLKLTGDTNINTSYDELFEYALNQEIIDDEIFTRISENRVILNKEGYYIIAYLLEKYLQENEIININE